MIARAILVAAALTGAAHADHEDAAHCLALVVYHEARGEIPIAQLGVFHVALNRAIREPGTICEVIRREHQFHVPHWPRPDDTAWVAAQVLVENALRFAVPDPTGGARYFVSDDKPRPHLRGLVPVRLGRITFWRSP